MPTRFLVSVSLGCACLASLPGCGDPGVGDSRATTLGTGIESAETGSDGNESNSNSGDGDGEPGDGDPGDGDGDGDPGEGGATKWDLAPLPDSSAQGCGLGSGGGPDFSYIWIANSGQGTMTKLNTDTMIEEGRYMMRPDGAGSPSRTSVALSGNVAIAARDNGGGVTKFWANLDDCEESNGMPGLQTSSGANDILAWNVEECHAWHQPFAGKNYWTNRPMAWAPGELNEGSCTWHDEMLWTSGTGNQTEVILLNGDTGDIAETIPIPQMPNGMMYGGAVDGEGNFWGLEYASIIVRVDREDFTVQSWPIPPGPGYGIAIDVEGRVWTCGDGHASRFDPDTEQWQSTPGASGGGIGGCMTDGATTLYHSRYPAGVMVAIDTETVMPIQEFVIPEYVHGVSVDFTGKVWGVTFGSSQVFRLDVETAEVLTYGGLTGAYTYSDMTGFGLSSVAQPSG